MTEGFESWSGQKVLFSTTFRPALGPTQPFLRWAPGTLSPWVKRPGREADHSPPSNAEVKKTWIYTSTPPIRAHSLCGILAQGLSFWVRRDCVVCNGVVVVHACAKCVRVACIRCRGNVFTEPSNDRRYTQPSRCLATAGEYTYTQTHGRVLWSMP
jgi:hypothetical protein